MLQMAGEEGLAEEAEALADKVDRAATAEPPGGLSSAGTLRRLSTWVLTSRVSLLASLMEPTGP